MTPWAAPQAEQLQRLWDTTERLDAQTQTVENSLAVHKEQTIERLEAITVELRSEMEKAEKQLAVKLTSQPFVVALAVWLVIISTGIQIILKALERTPWS